METTPSKSPVKMILLTAGAVAIGFVVGSLFINHLTKHLPVVAGKTPA